MVVQHNITAMNSNRMLGVTTKSQAKSTEKLSSGYKINRAADDAAGLSISEKMRKQIRGLTQASANAQDGISAVQTAEGALGEVHDMLQRMNELAVKASNGTMSADDRSFVQNEIDALVTEVDRVAETTKFNETYLLKGDDASNGFSRSYVATGTAVADVDGFSVETEGANKEISDGQKITVGAIGLASSVETVVASVTNLSGFETDELEFLESIASITASGGIGDASTGSAPTNVSVTFKDGNTGTYTTADFEAKSGLTLLKGTTANDTTVFSKSFEAATGGDFTATAGDNANLNNYKYGSDVDFYASVAGNGTVTLNSGDKKALVFDLQVGADTTASNKITLKIDSMSAANLGVQGLKVDGANSKNADAAVDTIAAAVKKVSTQRSALGAIQNRLEHTINNLDNIVENTTSAEAAIRDTDMATEMVRYSNNNILSQAGQAMLAQANQSNQGVLSLLQ